MTIKDAIQLAEGNGWKPNWSLICDNGSCNGFVLDPQFWQALGKGLGWPKDEDDGKGCDGCKNHYVHVHRYKDWKNRWHYFIDHLAQGGTIESYFAELK